MGRAWIDGRSVALEAAVGEAARLLAASRFPLIAGLGTDIAGARAAIALAERLGGAIDHMQSAALFNNLDVMRDSGMMIAAPREAWRRGDVVLLVGAGAADALAGLQGVAATQGARHVLWLCPGRAAAARAGIDVFGRDPADLPALLAALRARLAGRPVGKTRMPGKALDALAAALRAARYGVAVWSAAELDALAVDMLCGIVKDLNRETRFAGVPLAPGDNALGVLAACGWLSGLPMRTGFGRGAAEHDPWRFDAARLVQAGEVDCALWASAWRTALPPWAGDIPTIALTGDASTNDAAPARVHIEVGRPGIDHDAVAYDEESGTLTAHAAVLPGGAASVAGIVADIAAALPPAGA
jgi:formylmethanofuran dehydrogenase subunit B